MSQQRCQPVDDKVVPSFNPHFPKKSRRFKDRRGSGGVVSRGPYSRFQVQACFHLGFGCFVHDKPSKTNSSALSHNFNLNVFLLLVVTVIQTPLHEVMGFLSQLVSCTVPALLCRGIKRGIKFVLILSNSMHMEMYLKRISAIC